MGVLNSLTRRTRRAELDRKILRTANSLPVGPSGLAIATRRDSNVSSTNRDSSVTGEPSSVGRREIRRSRQGESHVIQFIRAQAAPGCRRRSRHALEWYDFIVFGFFAVVIARLFFPTESQY